MDSNFRFHPTEEELVNHYLRKKKQDKDFKVDHIIPEIDICKHVDSNFRFLPTEEELVNHYLRKKKQDKDFKVDHIIPEIDICKFEPWDVPGLLFTEPESPYQDMEEHPQPEDLELIFPALQLQDYMLEMDTEVADV